MAKKQKGYVTPVFGTSETARLFNCSAAQAKLIHKALKEPNKLTPSEYATVCRTYYAAMTIDTIHPCRSCSSRGRCQIYDIERTAKCCDWEQSSKLPVCRFGNRRVTIQDVAPTRKRKHRRRTGAKMRGGWPSRFNGPPCQGGLCSPK